MTNVGIPEENPHHQDGPLSGGQTRPAATAERTDDMPVNQDNVNQDNVNQDKANQDNPDLDNPGGQVPPPKPAKGKLSDDPRARAALARKNPKFGELDSAHSVGHDAKPHAQSGKLGKAEKKVRW
jgi:hypothetical protein